MEIQWKFDSHWILITDDRGQSNFNRISIDYQQSKSHVPNDKNQKADVDI